MDDKKFLHVTYSTVSFDMKPTPMQYAIRNASLVSDIISPLDLVMRVTGGYSYGNHAVREPKKPGKFIAGNVFSVDLEGSPSCALDIATGEEFFKDFGLFAYTTISHTEENPRCRLVFAIEKPVTDADEYRMIARSICTSWAESADRGSWEPLRIFLGNPNGRLIWNGALLPEDICRQMVREVRRREEQERMEKEALRQRSSAWQEERSAESFVEYALRKVSTAREGERNSVLNRIAFITGKHYVKTGKVDEDFIKMELLYAALACGLEEREAIATIKSGISRGKIA